MEKIENFVKMTEIDTKFVIDNLPDEILEFILSFLPPYKDLEECMLVNKRWYRSVQNVIKTTCNNLNRAIADFNIRWDSVRPTDMAATITKRYCHSACVYGNSMYVFGGCTSSSTTFNDLWRLDLSKRQWVRPLTTGTYPSPKACATLACYKDSLILFGGWTHPSHFPWYQTWVLFNELHIYNITSNRWNIINSNHPPPIANHSVSIHGNLMVLFGGLQMTDMPGQYSTSNDIWCFNLDTYQWYKPFTSNVKPVARYGHSQIVLDEQHILIIGGCGGPNCIFNDVWLLDLSMHVWTWTSLSIKNKEWAPTHLWCNPACRIGNKIVVLSREPDTNGCISSFSTKCNIPAQLRPTVWFPPSGPPRAPFHNQFNNPIQCTERPNLPVPDRDENVNGRRGRFNSRNLPSSSSDDEPEPAPAQPGPSGIKPDKAPPSPPRIARPKLQRPFDSPINLSAFTSPEEKKARNRERQLASLLKMEERIKNLSKRNNNPAKPPPREDSPEKPNVDQPKPKKTRKHVLGMYVLDISEALNPTDPHVTWLPWKNTELTDGPEEIILYSLVPGKGELIMFGGIQKSRHVSNNCTVYQGHNQISNSLHFITAPKIQI